MKPDTVARTPHRARGTRHGRVRTMSFATLLLIAACSRPADAVAPASVARFVEAARSALHLQDDLHRDFAFRSARCRADGGMVLLFEQRGARAEGVAFAMSGTPRADPGSWAGGFAPIDPETDPELAAFFAVAREIRCP